MRKTSDKRVAAAERGESGFTLLELMTVVAVLGILAVMAMPSMVSMLQRQETKTSATQMAGLLSDARARAMSEGTPHLVYFNPPSVDGNGECGAVAVEVRDADHSYSITAGDDTREFHLPAGACSKVTPYGASDSPGETVVVPMPLEDLAVRAPDAGSVGAVVSSVASGVGNAVAAAAPGGSSGNSGSSSSSSEDEGEDEGSTASASSASAAAASVDAATRSATVAETAVNGATFPVDAESGRPVIAFSERGIPVDPTNPTSWGSGAGGVYLTDGSSTVYAALVAPLGDVKLRVFDTASQSWK